MLKRNRVGIQQWLSGLPPGDRQKIFSDARKHGPKLRQKHRLSELAVQAVISEAMLKEKQPKRRGRKKKETATDAGAGAVNTAADAMLQEEAVNETRDAAEAELATLMPKDVSMQAGHYVAVAYQDNWYPGC